MRNMVPKASKSQKQPLFPLKEFHKKTKSHNCHIYTEGLGQSCAGSLVVGSVSVSIYKPKSVDFVATIATNSIT